MPKKYCKNDDLRYGHGDNAKKYCTHGFRTGYEIKTAWAQINDLRYGHGLSTKKYCKNGFRTGFEINTV